MNNQRGRIQIMDKNRPKSFVIAFSICNVNAISNIRNDFFINNCTDLLSKEMLDERNRIRKTTTTTKYPKRLHHFPLLDTRVPIILSMRLLKTFRSIGFLLLRFFFVLLGQTALLNRKGFLFSFLNLESQVFICARIQAVCILVPGVHIPKAMNRMCTQIRHTMMRKMFRHLSI